MIQFFSTISLLSLLDEMKNLLLMGATQRYSILVVPVVLHHFINWLFADEVFQQ
jgi:hypothetical protein